MNTYKHTKNNGGEGIFTRKRAESLSSDVQRVQGPLAGICPKGLDVQRLVQIFPRVRIAGIRSKGSDPSQRTGSIASGVLARDDPATSGAAQTIPSRWNYFHTLCIAAGRSCLGMLDRPVTDHVIIADHEVMLGNDAAMITSVEVPLLGSWIHP